MRLLTKAFKALKNALNNFFQQKRLREFFNVLQPAQSSETQKKVNKIIFIYAPGALLTLITFFSYVYLAAYYSELEVDVISVEINALKLVEAGIFLLADKMKYFIYTILAILFVYALLYKHQFNPKYEKTVMDVTRLFLMLAPVVMWIFFLQSLAYSVEKGMDDAQKQKAKLFTSPRTKILDGDKVIEGVIIAMSNSMVWIYTGEKTIAMPIGNKTIIL